MKVLNVILDIKRQERKNNIVADRRRVYIAYDDSSRVLGRFHRADFTSKSLDHTLAPIHNLSYRIRSIIYFKTVALQQRYIPLIWS